MRDEVRDFSHVSAPDRQNEFGLAGDQGKRFNFRILAYPLRDLVVTRNSFRYAVDENDRLAYFDIGLLPVDDGMIAGNDIVFFQLS